MDEFQLFLMTTGVSKKNIQSDSIVAEQNVAQSKLLRFLISLKADMIHVIFLE